MARRFQVAGGQVAGVDFMIISVNRRPSSSPSKRAA